MVQHSEISSASAFEGIRVASVPRTSRRRTRSKVSKCQQSDTVPHDESLAANRYRYRSETLTSTEDQTIVQNKTEKYARLKLTQKKQFIANQSWKEATKILWSICCILMLTIIILPSIFVYIYAPKPIQTMVTTPSTHTNHCASVSSNKNWQLNDTTTLTMTIDTSVCQFSTTPLYFISVAGTGSHFCLTGYGGIYQPTKDSFRIFAKSTCNYWNGTDFLNAAYSNAWDVNWMGFYK